MKRNRWDSSSDEEDENDDDNNNAVVNKLQVTEKKKKKSKDKNTNNFLRHNPLLQGCRSVYANYERLCRISEGTFGVVWKAKDLATNEVVALKQIKFDADIITEGFPISALREISVLLSFNHECIVTVREMVVGDALDKVFMVMEYMEMDLKDAMERDNKKNPFSQSELKGMIFQILSGIDHIHNKWLLHRDLKTSNILVHRSGRIALADFGLARKYQHPLIKPMTLPVITLWYRPPELLFGETVYGPAVDMWSIGCIYGELIIKNAIMQGEGELDQIDKIFHLVGTPSESNWPEFTNLPNSGILRWKELKEGEGLTNLFTVNSFECSSQTFLDGNGFNLLQRLLTLSPNRRITAKDALDHAYFKEGVQKSVPKFSF